MKGVMDSQLLSTFGETKNYSSFEKYLWPVFLISNYALADRDQWESIALPASDKEVTVIKDTYKYILKYP